MDALEPRESPVVIDLVFAPDFPAALVPPVLVAAETVSSLLSGPPLPAVAPTATLTPLGRDPAPPPVPPDTLRVYVGVTGGPELGLGGVGGYEALASLSRSWGGYALVNPVTPAPLLPTVATHELLHAAAVGHSDRGIMAASIASPQSLTPADADAIRSAGWQLSDSAPSVIVPNPYGCVGWVALTPDVSADWHRAGNA